MMPKTSSFSSSSSCPSTSSSSSSPPSPPQVTTDTTTKNNKYKELTMGILATASTNPLSLPSIGAGWLRKQRKEGRSPLTWLVLILVLVTIIVRHNRIEPPTTVDGNGGGSRLSWVKPFLLQDRSGTTSTVDNNDNKVSRSRWNNNFGASKNMEAGRGGVGSGTAITKQTQPKAKRKNEPEVKKVSKNMVAELAELERPSKVVDPPHKTLEQLIRENEKELVLLEDDCKIKRRIVKREKESSLLGIASDESQLDVDRCEASIRHSKNRLKRREERIEREGGRHQQRRRKKKKKKDKSKTKAAEEATTQQSKAPKIGSRLPDFLSKSTEEWGHEEEVEFLKFFKGGYPTWWGEEKVDSSSPADMECPHVLDDRMQTSAANRKRKMMLTPTYMDRSGSVIKRMIEVYAYCQQHGYSFGGSINRVRDPDWQRKRVVHEQLISGLGLTHILKFITPMKGNENQYNLDWPRCVHGIQFNETFLKDLRSKQNWTEIEIATGSNTLSSNKRQQHHGRSVAVHMRRGDAHPCDGKIFRDRYQPNAYFLMSLNKYVDNKAVKDDDNAAGAQQDVVTIYSQTDSFEGFDEFRKHGYNLELDGTALDAWYAIMTADIVIVNPGSHFGEVPALLNPNGHVYSNQKHHYNFIQIDDDILLRSAKILNRTIDERCEQWMERHPEHKEKHTLW